MKFYAVRVGRVPGIYESWSEAEAQVKGIRAEYKSFPRRELAEAWLVEPRRGSAVAKPSKRDARSEAQILADLLEAERHSAIQQFALPILASHRDFYLQAARSARTGRVAWCLWSCDAPPLVQLYSAAPPEETQRGLLCALLRLLTRAQLDPALRDKRLIIHLGHPMQAVYQALTSWIFVWSKKRWHNGAVRNCDLYKAAYQLLKRVNVRFEYDASSAPSGPLAEALLLAERCAAEG